VARRLSVAADAGDPVHVTGWDLARDPLTVRSETSVLVCENPRVLEAVARRSWTGPGERPAVVCTSGVPGLVTTEVLQRLAACGARLAYHGDFDWPGIAMADRLVAQVGCRPWRMGTADYLRGVRADGPPLVGTPVAATWDARLRAEMLRHGRAVHEEAQLDELLEALPELASYLGAC
jgi:uncharacterized protein (TIGR02679 family)